MLKARPKLTRCMCPSHIEGYLQRTPSKSRLWHIVLIPRRAASRPECTRRQIFLSEGGDRMLECSSSLRSLFDHCGSTKKTKRGIADIKRVFSPCCCTHSESHAATSSRNSPSRCLRTAPLSTGKTPTRADDLVPTDPRTLRLKEQDQEQEQP